MNEQDIILVNDTDEAVGTMEKMEAHRKGELHRAFSIFIFNSNGEMLLQQRSLHKYHSGGLWTNACCSHPHPGEDLEAATRRRLQYEMGIETGITKLFDFIYAADLENGLKEYEFDHVFAGEYDGEINPNPEEVMNYCYRSMDEIRDELVKLPKKFTVWFHVAFPKVELWWVEKYAQSVSKKN